MDDKDWRRKAPLGGTWLLMALLAQGAAEATSARETPTFHIPKGDAKKTLLQFYQQSGVKALYLSEDVEGKKTHTIIGQFAPSAALEKMLEGTGLVFEFENEESAIIKAQGVFAPLETLADAQVQVETGIHEPLPEVLVTGSWIRGVLDIPSPVVHVTREELKRSAYATVHDAMQHLPLNARAMQSEDFGGTGNYARGTGLNLRGLGSGATLVLVNGRRQASAGYEGDFVDVSNVPWSAIEEIEILPDGTSALYGSDAIAGVVNIKMREDLDQPETIARAGSAIGGGGETLVSQLFGNRWQTGKYFFAYQYSERTALDASDRPYVADSDKRPFGGRNFSSIASNPGNLLDPTTLQPVFAIPLDQDGSSLEPGDLLPGIINYENTFAGYQLLPDRKMHSAYFSATQRLNERFEMFGEGRFSRVNVSYSAFPWEEVLLVPSTNAYFVDAFEGMPYALVAYNFLDDLGPLTGEAKTQNGTGVIGLKTDLGPRWQSTLSGSFASESLTWHGNNFINFDALATALADSDPATAFNPFGAGSHTNPATLEKIRLAEQVISGSTILSASLVADGPIFDLPGGAAKLAVGSEHRRERLTRGIPRRAFDREISSAFSELSLPLIGDFSNPRTTPRLEVAIAGRYERYSDFGDSFDPKIGVQWAPFDGFKVRASWGTSFRAPKLADIYDEKHNIATSIFLPDPQSPSGQSEVLVIEGNNPDLHEETANTWSAGFDIVPTTLPNTELSLTYFAIEYKDRIAQPASVSPFDILLQEGLWSNVILRNPSKEQVAAVCTRPDFVGSLSDCLASSPAVILDGRLRNLASTRTHGLDLKFDYFAVTQLGQFRLGLEGAYVLGFEQRVSDTAPILEFVNTVYNPLRLRARNTLEWFAGGKYATGLNIGVALMYMSSYRDPESPMVRKIPALVTMDFNARYRVPETRGEGYGLELGFNAANIFDREPPFVDRVWGYDILNSRSNGRVVNLYIQKNW